MGAQRRVWGGRWGVAGCLNMRAGARTSLVPRSWKYPLRQQKWLGTCRPEAAHLWLGPKLCDGAMVLHKPRLLSENGPSYIAGERVAYIEAHRMSHVRSAPFHPQTQGRIEGRHLTPKNRIVLENGFLPGDLEAQIKAFIEHHKSPALSREPEWRDARRYLLRQGSSHQQTARKDQATDHRTSVLATPSARRRASIPGRGPQFANLRRDLRQIF